MKMLSNSTGLVRKLVSQALDPEGVSSMEDRLGMSSTLNAFLNINRT